MNPLKQALFLLPALFAAGAATFGGACTPTCVDDLDCPRGDLQCVDGSCEALPGNVPDQCTGDDECLGGRICVDAECRFAPSCQTVLEGSPFRWVAACAVAGETRGDAAPSTSGCLVSFALQGLAAQNRTLQVGPFGGESVMAENITPAGGELSCSGGGWNGATNTLLMTGCDVAGDTCDVMVTRRRPDITACLDDAACGAGTCAADVQVGASIAGRCQ